MISSWTQEPLDLEVLLRKALYRGKVRMNSGERGRKRNKADLARWRPTVLYKLVYSNHVMFMCHPVTLCSTKQFAYQEYAVMKRARVQRVLP
jgi:hypothetical protein